MKTVRNGGEGGYDEWFRLFHPYIRIVLFRKHDPCEKGMQN